MSRRLEFGLVLLLAVAITVAVVAGRRSAGSGPEQDLRASTLLSGPLGSRALYDVLVRLGIPVERRRTPLFDLGKSDGRRAATAVLVVLDPPRELLAAELAQVVRLVRAGGAVVAAGAGAGITRCVGWSTSQGRRFFPADTFAVVSPKGLELPPVADFLQPLTDLEARRRLRGGPSDADECETLPPPVADTLLRLADGRPTALRLKYGAGSVTLFADVGYFRNRAWRASDVPYFVAPLLVPPRGVGQGRRWRGRVTWDEYHQGFGRSSSVAGLFVGWLAGTPAGWAVLQVVAVVVVGLAMAAVRFGPAQRVIERRRRSPLEHLEALAAGLEGAAGVETAVDLTVSGLRRRLGRAGVPRAAEMGSWLAGLELALATPAGRDAVRRLQRIVTQPGGPERALRAAQAVEDVWEELRPSPTRATS